jgi:hypothetical protein
MQIKTHDKRVTFNYSTQNILKASIDRVKAKEHGATILIPHVCNNVNAFGAGFAKAVAEEFPIVKESFHLLAKPVLGKNQVVPVLKDKQYEHELIFINMIAQNGLLNIKNPRPLNYGALVFCMSEVRSLVKLLKNKSDTSKIEIHTPKFGSGLSGGNWDFISDLIDDIWYDLTVYVYKFK